VSALDSILAKVRELNGAAVLFVAPCRYCGPGPGVLLMQAKDGMWELPSYEVAPDSILDAPAIFGDVLISRCEEFQPVLGERYDDHCWTSPEFAVGCAANHPSATAALKEFLASSGDHKATGEKVMDSAKDFIDAQAKADRVFRAYGDSAPAALNGESLNDYRCRLARTFQSHSKQFKSADLSKLGDAHVLTAIEDAIYADASAALHDPATFKAGELRPIITRDPSGREITKYIGQDGACWDQFNPPIRHVRRIITPGSGLH
jgi:hypothetical protein